jgi:3-phenylpropionate/trans-cinnamate dioxygenase ferredoxin subunit
MGCYIRAASADDVAPGNAKLVEIDGKSIALFNIGGTYYALDNACTHQGGPLSEGTLQGKEVTCPWHGAVFDVTTGAVLQGPAMQNVACYPVRVVGSDVEIEI